MSFNHCRVPQNDSLFSLCQPSMSLLPLFFFSLFPLTALLFPPSPLLSYPPHPTHNHPLLLLFIFHFLSFFSFYFSLYHFHHQPRPASSPLSAMSPLLPSPAATCIFDTLTAVPYTLHAASILHSWA